jgi:hypothetical protein
MMNAFFRNRFNLQNRPAKNVSPNQSNERIARPIKLAL